MARSCGCQLLSTLVTVVTAGVGLIVTKTSNPHFQWASASLWCAPFYFGVVSLGSRAWRLGENSTLLAYIAANFAQFVPLGAYLDVFFNLSYSAVIQNTLKIGQTYSTLPAGDQ